MITSISSFSKKQNKPLVKVVPDSLMDHLGLFNEPQPPFFKQEEVCQDKRALVSSQSLACSDGLLLQRSFLFLLW